jgi:hypothetical protein
VARAALPGSRRCRTRERPRRQLQVSPAWARSVDLRALWRSKRVAFGRVCPAVGVARLRSRARCLRSRIAWWRACRPPDWGFVGVGVPAGVAVRCVSPGSCGGAEGIEPLTPCMPCHPHDFTQHSAALPGITSPLVSQDAGRGAAMRCEAAREHGCRGSGDLLGWNVAEVLRNPPTVAEGVDELPVAVTPEHVLQRLYTVAPAARLGNSSASITVASPTRTSIWMNLPPGTRILAPAGRRRPAGTSRRPAPRRRRSGAR